jgi:hypothetical protein
MLGVHGYDHGSLYRRGITYVKYRHENINGPYSVKDRGHWYYLKSERGRIHLGLSEYTKLQPKTA